ncbi:MAG TPA: ABC transporter ATP-binding protein [Actinomycetota bacterium]|nr:ABC transporter ATP-binding protein [Actinomycetota bacterium]
MTLLDVEELRTTFHLSGTFVSRLAGRAGAAVAHPLIIHGLAGREEACRRAAGMLERVGLEPAGRFLDAYPTDLSGGQKQRAVIARALMLGPELIVADEPVSMLDASVRTKILSLLLDLQASMGLTYVFITHDLATARFVCDSIGILYLGQVVEQGPARAVFAEPRHPYTRALLAAVPQPDPSRRGKKEIPGGEIPDATAPPAHCRFHPRCPRAFGPCGFEAKDLVDALEARWTGLGEEAFASERALLGRLLPHGRTLTIVPAGGGSVEEVVQLLERLRDEGAPAFRTIQSITSGRGVVAVELPPGRDPEPVAVDGTLVACHLYPEASQ